MSIEEYQRIITSAIGDEIEAYQFYTDVAEKVQDSNMRYIFTSLADEEKKHREFLEGVLSGGKPLNIDESKDYRIAATVDKPKLSMDMKPADAIALAMKKEEEAMDTYAKLTEICIDEEQKELFGSLARMEQGHKVRLEEIYTNMAFTEVW